jgi:hypothetical protein
MQGATPYSLRALLHSLTTCSVLLTEESDENGSHSEDHGLMQVREQGKTLSSSLILVG